MRMLRWDTGGKMFKQKKKEKNKKRKKQRINRKTDKKNKTKKQVEFKYTICLFIRVGKTSLECWKFLRNIIKVS